MPHRPKKQKKKRFLDSEKKTKQKVMYRPNVKIGTSKSHVV
jgi:hypothetical protein